MIDPGIVKYCVQDFKNKYEVFDYLADLLYENGRITDKEEYVAAVRRREDVIPTEVGHAIAVPHGESECVNESFVACLKLKEPIRWDKEDVQYVFNIGIPLKDRNTEQIKILAKLCSNFMVEQFRESLYQAKDEKEFFDVVAAIED